MFFGSKQQELPAEDVLEFATFFAMEKAQVLFGILWFSFPDIVRKELMVWWIHEGVESTKINN